VAPPSGDLVSAEDIEALIQQRLGEQKANITIAEVSKAKPFFTSRLCMAIFCSVLAIAAVVVGLVVPVDNNNAASSESGASSLAPVQRIPAQLPDFDQQLSQPATQPASQRRRSFRKAS
jgi:hypothetical protein